MDFFVDHPVILGGTQTFVATLATLIVLCLFRNEANFLRGIMRSLSLDLESEITQKLSLFRKKLKDSVETNDIPTGLTPTPEQQEQMQHAMEKDLAIYDFFTAAKRERRRYDVAFERFDNREEPRYVATLLFIIVMVVLCMDCMNVSQEIGSLFLYSANYLLTISSMVLWAEYAFGGRIFLGIKRWQARKWSMVLEMLIILIFGAIFISLYIFGMPFVVRSFIAILFSTIVAIWMHNTFVYIRNNNWMGYKSVVKFGVFLSSVCLFITAGVFVSSSYSWLSDRVGIQWFGMLQGWQDRTSYLSTSIIQMRVWFVLICIADTFVASLVVAYLYNKISQLITLYKINFLFHKADWTIQSIGTLADEPEETIPSRDRTVSRRRRVKAKRKNRKSRPKHSIILWLVSMFS